MIYSHEVQHMCVVKKGANHQCALGEFVCQVRKFSKSKNSR